MCWKVVEDSFFNVCTYVIIIHVIYSTRMSGSLVLDQLQRVHLYTLTVTLTGKHAVLYITMYGLSCNAEVLFAMSIETWLIGIVMQSSACFRVSQSVSVRVTCGLSCVQYVAVTVFQLE